LKLISCRNVSFHYPAQEGQTPGATVLDGINLEIGRGEFVAVLGHNGSGKSTFAKLLNAILIPTKGEVFVDGIDTQQQDKLLEVRRRVGMVFQNPDNQIVATVVEEDVAFALENLGLPTGEIRRRVDDALAAVEMTEYATHPPHRLSGGQKQRVAIAGIIAMRPDCIVLDEPTAMLDPRGRREVMLTLEALNKNHGVSVVLITHYMDEAARAERVVVMDAGKVLLDAPPGEVFSHTQLLTGAGLDVPQAAKLCYELRCAGVNLPGEIIDEDACVHALLQILK